MNAFSIWSMLTKHFGNLYSVISINSGAVKTLSTRSMAAFGVVLSLLSLLLRKRRFLLVAYAIQTLSTRRMVAFGGYSRLSTSISSYSISLALMPVCIIYFLGFLELTFNMAPSVK